MVKDASNASLGCAGRTGGWRVLAPRGGGRWWLVWLLLAGGCVAAKQGDPLTLPDQDLVEREQLVLHADFKLPRHHRLVDELVALRHDVSDRLQLPTSDEPIHVYLFEDSARFQGYISQYFPQLPDRRAFFVESDTRLTVFAQWGDRVAEDLRHEVTHGYLHAVVRNLPLWLDEGLAEYHEVPRGQRGVHRQHIHLLRDRYSKYFWKPGLDRLQRFTELTEMKQIDYAESWLVVHWLLETTPARLALLQNYLARLRMTGESPPLLRFLSESEPHYDQQLLTHLEFLQQEVDSDDN